MAKAPQSTRPQKLKASRKSFRRKRVSKTAGQSLPVFTPEELAELEGDGDEFDVELDPGLAAALGVD